MAPSADRNLLFGVLAYQNDFIRQDQLLAAVQAWSRDKAKPIAAILREQQALTEDQAVLLEALVDKHVAAHEGSPEKSLAALSSLGSLKEELGRIADSDVQASLTHISVQPMDIFATIPPVKGTANEPRPSAPLEPGMRFRILRPHAKGGLGEVFVAHDEELHREVALKEIQERSADDPESRSRFMVEAEITGGLEHPGIVPVYGLGTYADGRPYYAMRFIRGDSLKDAIDRFHRADLTDRDPGQRALALRALLGRFVDVCNAIAYAHSRGVLHRDLKPGNIMLGKYGETLVVDWGLAKPVGDPKAAAAEPKPGPHEPGEGSLIPYSISGSSQTLLGSTIGTPQYMSPEQAAGMLDKLGPASDVYSLGATLYCLLTGQPPFTDRDVAMVLLNVMNGDFPRPRRIKENIAPPLEAICLKAMAMRAEDRYPTPRELSDDVEAWLADEPVSAWPEPWTVKARRWIGRHATLCTSVGSAVVVALVGLIIATILLTAANERERQAKLKAAANFELARAAVDRYHRDVSETDLLYEPGMEPLRLKLLGAAREFYEKFKKERKDDPSVQAELGRATFRLAQITGDLGSELDALAMHEEAAKIFESLPKADAGADLQSDRAECYHHLGRLCLLTDQLGKAETSYHKADGLWKHLTADHPKEDRYRDGLARTQLGLGNVAQVRRRLDVARGFYQQATDNWTALHKAHPDTQSYRRDLAVAQNNIGMIDKAIGGKEQAADEALRFAQTLQKQLVKDAPNIGKYRIDLARTDFNLRDFKDAAEQLQAIVQRHPAVTEPHRTLADAHADLALLFRLPDEAKKAEEIQRKLVARHAGVSSYEGYLARGLWTVGEVSRAAGKREQAQAAYDEALRIQEKLAKDRADIPHYRRDLARTQHSLGSFYLATDAAKSDAAFKNALALWEGLLKDHARELDYSIGLSRTCFSLGDVARNGKHGKDALVLFDRALDCLDAKGQPRVENPEVKEALMVAHQARAVTLTQMGKVVESVPDWDRALVLMDERDPRRPRVQLPRAMALARAAKYKEAVEAAETVTADASLGTPPFLFARAQVYSVCAAAAGMGSEPDLADQYGKQAVKLLSAAFAEKTFNTKDTREKLKNDTDLQALRGRPDFQKLVSDLDGG
jgi:serine/threonine-protein kinase